MATNVVMPQMGESVAEGTVVRWIKKVGDRIDRDEPLFEISTDKVDAEIPSPAAGVLTEIRVKEGETVPVDSVVAVIGSDVAVSAGTPATAVALDEPAHEAPAPKAPVSRPASSTAAVRPAAERPASASVIEPVAETLDTEAWRDHLRRTKSSPLVRRIAHDHNVDITRIHGSGVGGRVTKQDILRHLEEGPAPAAKTAAPAPVLYSGHMPTFAGDAQVEAVPMSVMRKKIAEHMIFSQETSAHVHSVFEVDFQRVSQIRAAKKDEYERKQARLTVLAFIASAVCRALRAVPVVNSSIDADKVVYKKELNLGIAVALEWGLIVPVIHNAGGKNLLELSRAIADLSTRARAKALKPEEVQEGTFTITNPGTLGTLFGMPIINQPQVAILAVGAIEKRAVVIDDGIHIRPRGYLTLGYDHRLIDGAVADAFMATLKREIENFDSARA